jgi:hypothetical protein
MPSLGYLLGDEASGADIGRHLLQDAFYGRIPVEVHARIFGGIRPGIVRGVGEDPSSPTSGARIGCLYGACWLRTWMSTTCAT